MWWYFDKSAQFRGMREGGGFLMGFFATRDGVYVDHQLDLANALADRSGWSVERVDDNRAVLAANGIWRTYELDLSWIDSACAFQISCAFSLRPSPERTPAVLETLRLHNDRMIFGGFSLDLASGAVRYRYALPLDFGQDPPEVLVARLVEFAVEACDSFYPAVRLVASARNDPEDALEAAVLETIGSA